MVFLSASLEMSLGRMSVWDISRYLNEWESLYPWFRVGTEDYHLGLKSRFKKSLT
jgi:hypothetical protein